MSIIINAAVESDANPFSMPTGLTIRNGTFKIVSNVLRQNYDAGIVCATATSPATSGILSVKFKTNRTHAGSSDRNGAVFCDSSGNGFFVYLAYDLCVFKEIAAFAIGASFRSQISGLTYAVGDEFQVTYDLATNTISAYQTALGTPLLGDATGLTKPSGMSHGQALQWDDSGSAGFTSVTIDGLASSNTIDTIDNPITVGTPFNLTTTGLGTLTTASTIGGVPVTAANAPSGDGTLTYSFTNGVLGPLMGTVSVVASDGTNTATATGKTLQTMSGYTSIVLASLDRSATSLGSEPAINNGDEVHAPNLGGGTLAATGLFTSVLFGTYSGFWKRDATDGKMYTFTVILSSTGTTVTGLTGVGLTVSKITVSGLTSKPM